MKKTTRRKVLAFVLAFAMLLSTVFGTTALSIFADDNILSLEQIAEGEQTTDGDTTTEIPTTENSTTENSTTENSTTTAETTIVEDDILIAESDTEQTKEDTTIGDVSEVGSDAQVEEMGPVEMVLLAAEGNTSTTAEGALKLEGSTVAGSIKVKVTLANGRELESGTKYGVDQMFEAKMEYTLLNTFTGENADETKTYYFTYQMPENISTASSQVMTGNLNGQEDGSNGRYTVSESGLVTFIIPGTFLRQNNSVSGTFTYRFTADEDKINEQNQLKLEFPGTADSITISFSEPDVKYGNKSCWMDSQGNIHYSIVVETDSRSIKTLRIVDKPESNLEINADSFMVNGKSQAATKNGDGSFSIDISNATPNEQNQITYTARIKNDKLDRNRDGRVDDIDNEAIWYVNGRYAGRGTCSPYAEVASLKADKTGWVDGQKIHWTVNINNGAVKQDVSDYTYTDTMTSTMTNSNGTTGVKKQQFDVGSIQVICNDTGQNVTGQCLVKDFNAANNSFTVTLPADAGTMSYKIEYTTSMDQSLDNGEKISVENKGDLHKGNVHVPVQSNQSIVASLKADKTGWVDGQKIHWTVNINNGAVKQDVSDYIYTDTMTSTMTNSDGTTGTKKQQFEGNSMQIICSDTAQNVTNQCVVNNFDEKSASFTVQLPADAGKKSYTITYTTVMDQALTNGEVINVTNRGEVGDITFSADQQIAPQEKIGVEKAAEGEFDTSTMTQKWRVVITPEEGSMTDPKFRDIIQNAGIGWESGYMGSTFDEASVEVKYETGTAIETSNYTMSFSQSDSAKNQKAQGNDIMEISFSGTFTAPIVITYATVDDGNGAANGKNICNTSIVNNKEVSSAWKWYAYKKGTNQYIFKEAGEPVYDKKEKAYIVTWNIYANTNPENWEGEGLLELKNKVFSVTENLPEGMEYFDTTEVKYCVKGNDDYWNKHWFPLPDSAMTSTVEGQKVTYTINGSVFKDYNFNPYIQITFRTKVSALNKELTNQVAFDVDNKTHKAEENITVKDTLLDKEASLSEDQTKLYYTIEVNPNGIRYNEGKRLELTDNIPDNVTLDTSTIRIVDENGKSIIDGKNCNWAYSNTQKVLTLYIPDETKATVTYMVQPNLDEIVQGGDGSYEVTVTNAVHFVGNVNQAEDVDTWYGKMFKSSGTIQGDTHYVTIKKTDKNTAQNLADARYQLWRFILNNPGNAQEGGYFANVIEGDTDAQGILKFKDMDADAIYYYVETVAPAGYVLDGTKHYFSIPGQEEAYQITIDALKQSDGTITEDMIEWVEYTHEFAATNEKSTNAAIQIEGSKTLDGTTDNLYLYDFTFTLTEVDEQGNVKANGKTQTVKCGRDGKIKFVPIEYGDTGVYYYRIAEKPGNRTDITYDTNSYNVRVDVTENVGGNLQASISIDNGGNIVFENTTKKGSITFTKEIAGNVLSGSDGMARRKEIWDKIVFTLNDGTKSTVIDKSKFENWGGATYFCTIDNLDLDKTYTVTETNYGYDGYTTTVTYQAGVEQVTNGSNTVAKVTLTESSPNGKLAIKNTYSKGQGSLRLTKTFADAAGNITNITDADKQKVEFTITGPNGYNETYKIGDQTKNLHFELDDDTGIYTLVLEDLPIGEYTIREKNYKVADYDCTISKKVDGVDKGSSDNVKVKVNNATTANVAYTNTYKQHLAKLQVSKKVVKGEGADLLDWNTIKGTIAFNLVDSDGKVLKTIKGSELTFDGTDAYVSTWYDVPAGKYDVVEDWTKSDALKGFCVFPTYTIYGEKQKPGDGVEITFTKDALFSVECSNEYIKGDVALTISKKSITGNDELPGANLTIEKKNGDAWEQLLSWKSGETARSFSLDEGTYKLIETTAPKGYTVAETIEFELIKDEDNDRGGTVKINGVDQKGNTVTMLDKPFTVNVSKWDITGTKEVPGATIKIFDADDTDAIDGAGNVKDESKALDEWTSKAGESHNFGEKLQAGRTYWLVETSAPKGYVYSESIKFTVGTNGVITDVTAGVDNMPGNAAADSVDNSIKMKDAPLSFKVSKEDLEGKEVSGAIIAIYEAKDISATGTVNIGATPVAEWISDGTTKEFGPELEADKSYVLVETGAPQGYAYAANIPFTIGKDGTVKVDSSMKDENGVVIVKDEVLHVNVNKTDLVSGEEVDGAVISIYRQTDVDAAGNPTGRALKEWISKAGETVDFGDVVNAGQSYVLIETTVADGYQKAENIAFTVNRDGTLKIKGQYLSSDGTQIIMKDAPEGLKLGQLTITKQIKGQVNEEELKGKLTFTITDKATGKVVREYKLDKFTYENGIYTLALTDLPEGSYVVEETAYMVDGKLCVVKYSVNSEPQVEGVKTPEIVISELTPQTVAYENDYSKDAGKLVITKTIEGDVTKEEAEGALTFEVKRMATGKTTTYTLKDFTYDAKTGKYTLELDVVPGGYTVTETTKDIDGYTCKVTYQINSGKKVKGDSASTTVEEGSVVTVAFEDEYKKEMETTDDNATDSANKGDKNPKTGDHTPLAACCMVMLAATGMATLATCYKKKKDSKDKTI